jgi:hypothetical protein
MAGKRRPVAAQVTQKQHPKRAGGKPTRELPAEGSLARRIRQKWGGLREELPLDRLEAELGDSRRYDIVAALKELEKAGLGEFSVGHKGQRASFVWVKGTRPVTKAVTTAPVAKAVNKTPVTKAPMGKARVTKSPAAMERRLSVEWERAPKRPPQRDPAEPAAQSTASGSALLPHTFHVRPQLPVTFHLPEDVTRAEIERLCLLLQALPFD